MPFRYKATVLEVSETGDRFCEWLNEEDHSCAEPAHVNVQAVTSQDDKTMEHEYNLCSGHALLEFSKVLITNHL